MDFLELCKRARRETRIPGTGPTTVIDQTGLLDDVVSAVRDAWADIQLLHFESWSFLRGVHDAELIPGTTEYQTGDLGLTDAAIILGISDAEGRPKHKIDWSRFIVKHDPKEREPTSFSVSPSNLIVFNDTPVDFMPIRIQYIRQLQTLINNTDEPLIAPHHHMTILWKAVMDLAANESDTVIYQKAYEKFDAGLSRLMVEYLPPIEISSRGVRFP